MISNLKRLYFILLVPAIVVLSAAFLFRNYYQGVSVPEYVLSIITPAIFMLSVFCSVAWPIFYRSCFSHHKRNLKQVNQDDLYKFEQNLIIIVMITPYLAAISYFLRLPSFYLSGIILIALYAIYYFYPSKSRINFDKKIFRLIDDQKI